MPDNNETKQQAQPSQPQDKKSWRQCPYCAHFTNNKCVLVAEGKFAEDDCGIWNPQVKMLPFFEPKVVRQAMRPPVYHRRREHRKFHGKHNQHTPRR